jgi:outer membrane protein assembly factor BamB
VPTDLVYAADLNGEVMAINAQTGATVWVTQVPSEPVPCSPGSANVPYARAGVIDTPTIDRRNGRMFLVAGDGSLYALAIDTGLPLSGYPLQIMDAINSNGEGVVFGSPSYDRRNGVLYVATAGRCEDGLYQGELIQIRVGTENTALPSILNRWLPTTANGGGIWGPGGVVIDQKGSAIYAATGNAFSTPENIDYAEHVVKLDNTLNVIASDGPALPGIDVDFGSTPLPFHPPGCPPMLAVMNKAGKVFVYNRDGAAISNGPFQVINVTETQDVGGFIGMASYDPQTNQLFFGNNQDSKVNPAFTRGLVAMGVQSDCTLAVNWVQTVGIDPGNGPPVIPATVAAGVVFFVSPLESVLYAFDTTSGNPLWNSGQLITGGIYAAPTVVNGMVLVADFSGNVTAFAPAQ